MGSRTVQLDAIYRQEERAAVVSHLERLLASPPFSHSKRFPSFLRYIVDEELNGRGSQLKERTIGVEVFGREPDYDTTADPIVRVTAAEIRKRIAQFYQGSPDTEGLHISLPPGSYVPHFEGIFAATSAEPIRAPEPIVEVASHVDTVSSSSLERSPRLPPLALESPAPRTYGRWLFLAAILLTVITLAGYYGTHRPADALDAFWAPVIAASEGSSVVICFPHNELQTVNLRDAAQPALQHSFPEQTKALILDDVQPLVSIAQLLSQRHRQYLLMDESAPLTDLRRAPTVFLGAFDNSWTLRITRDLRFRFGNNPTMTRFWIEDTQHPESHWEIDRTQQVATNNYRDYALVARFTDASTGQLAIVSAGIARGGTVAAGEFLTQPGTMSALKSHAPKGWAGQNMEFVLSTEIIDGRSAPPKIEAIYFW